MDECAPACQRCLQQNGLCGEHSRHVLPQLAVNLGWLRLMGDATVEQVSRQTVQRRTRQDQRAIDRIQKRKDRKSNRLNALRQAITA